MVPVTIGTGAAECVKYHVFSWQLEAPTSSAVYSSIHHSWLAGPVELKTKGSMLASVRTYPSHYLQDYDGQKRQGHTFS